MPRFPAVKFLYTAGLTVGVLVGGVSISQAAELEVEIAIKDHKFQPATVMVPAGQAIKLIVKNMDNDVEEFESHPLRFEKIIGPGESSIIRLQPLSKGEYTFFGEYHEDTAQGKIVAE